MALSRWMTEASCHLINICNTILNVTPKKIKGVTKGVTRKSAENRAFLIDVTPKTPKKDILHLENVARCTLFMHRIKKMNVY